MQFRAYLPTRSSSHSREVITKVISILLQLREASSTSRKWYHWDLDLCTCGFYPYIILPPLMHWISHQILNILYFTMLWDWNSKKTMLMIIIEVITLKNLRSCVPSPETSPCSFPSPTPAYNPQVWPNPDSLPSVPIKAPTCIFYMTPAWVFGQLFFSCHVLAIWKAWLKHLLQIALILRPR
jgi:hypothetical protein